MRFYFIRVIDNGKYARHLSAHVVYGSVQPSGPLMFDNTGQRKNRCRGAPDPGHPGFFLDKGYKIRPLHPRMHTA